MAKSGCPEDRGGADARNGRNPRPHKMVDGKKQYDLTKAEQLEYLAAHDAEEDRKEYG